MQLNVPTLLACVLSIPSSLRFKKAFKLSEKNWENKGNVFFYQIRTLVATLAVFKRCERLPLALAEERELY